MTMAIDFDAIRREYPLEQVVSQALPLKRAGANKVAVCPFHPDRSPSLVIYKDDTYHCFGCGAHGDVIDFVAGTQHLSIGESIRFLTGGQAPRLDDADRERREREARHREAQQKKRQENATLDARARWARAHAINGKGNAYLERKGVAPYGTRCEGDNLLVPIYDDAGLIMSVQSIPAEPGARKLFHAGAPVAGGTLALGDADQGPIVIVEGFATGATIQAASGLLVLVGFSKGALKRTAQIAQRRYPGREIIIAADTNGLEAAEAAAKAVSGRVIVPDLQGADGTDFNDQAGHYGLEDVAAMFRAPEPLVSSDRPVRASPFVWRDPATVPKREWIYGKHLLRKFVSVDVAAGGVGKSSLKIGEALAMASGRDLYAQGLHGGPHTVWLYNLEDPTEETERRIYATADRFKLEPQVFGQRLYVDSGRDQRCVIAEETQGGVQVVRPVVDAIIAEILDRKIDVLIIDPFVSSHAVSENDNMAIDVVVKEWARIADVCNCSINLVHHVRKQNGSEATADSARGASSLIGAARSVMVFNRMSKEEAEKVQVAEDEARFYFRVDNDKANLAPPGSTTWYRMNNVDLPNGDSVGVACPWTAPDVFEGISVHDLIRVQKAVGAGEWRENSQALAWVGKPVSEALGLDLNDRKQRSRVAALIKAWVREGALEIVEMEDSKRNKRPFVVVGNWAQL
ncbi:AAA family ATPase [Sphingomonas sp. 1P06PA]|uniref:AAA family ATPase n=1 Tax=Sphingomonas sp. 1P06PA TaxID=554121 RepID=UPI0039A607B2